MNSPMTAHEGAPVEPTGNPMLSNMGPAAYADRADVPDLTYEGALRIVPLRVAPGFFINPRDPDPRGMTVIGADGVTVGAIIDVWVDRAEPTPRYYEVALEGAARTVLLPAPFARLRTRHNQVVVKSILASQFANVPATAAPDSITLLEEDKIQAYFASGYLYATPDRQGPLL